jgi:hypothetical protein
LTARLNFTVPLTVFVEIKPFLEALNVRFYRSTNSKH